MAEIVFPDDLVAAQRRVDAAWAAVEAHRKGVDERRRGEARAAGARPDDARPWAPAPLPPWTEADDTRHAELMAEARAAAEARHAALAASGLGDGYEVVQGLHRAARGK